MDKETKKLLEQILFQLHVISSHTANFLACFQTEYGREELRKFGIEQVAIETEWIDYAAKKMLEELQCHSGTVSSSDS